MRQLRFHISLYIIIPFIFSGFSIFSSLLTFRVTKYSLEQKAEPTTWVFWVIVAISVLSFAAGFSLVRFLLRPVEKFVEKASQLPAFNGAPPPKSRKDWSVDKIEQFTSVFDRVTSVLSRIEARHFFPEIIGESTTMRGLLSLIMKVAPTDSTVLILGESGTGKELVATSIYEHSQRKSKPFVKLNCAAIPEELLESELFGHEKGAFTGATAFKPGKFDMAHGGTIFLDEIGDMPLNLQAKILRVLQEKEFYRVGGSHTIKVDVRFITATNKYLLQDVRDGSFREDLYYRLNVFPIVVPPLRERREDVLPLVDYFVDKFNKKLDIAVTVDGEVKEMLSRYEWPGNIRELENLMERMMLMARSKRLTLSEIPAELMGRIGNSAASSGNEDKKPFKDFLRSHMEDVERQMIIRCLEESGSNVTKAAKMMGLSRKGLQIKMIKYNLRK